MRVGGGWGKRRWSGAGRGIELKLSLFAPKHMCCAQCLHDHPEGGDCPKSKTNQNLKQETSNKHQIANSSQKSLPMLSPRSLSSPPDGDDNDVSAVCQQQR